MKGGMPMKKKIKSPQSHFRIELCKAIIFIISAVGLICFTIGYVTGWLVDGREIVKEGAILFILAGLVSIFAMILLFVSAAQVIKVNQIFSRMVYLEQTRSS
jgi:uncharacterized membrane protein